MGASHSAPPAGTAAASVPVEIHRFCPSRPRIAWSHPEKQPARLQSGQRVRPRQECCPSLGRCDHHDNQPRGQLTNSNAKGSQNTRAHQRPARFTVSSRSLSATRMSVHQPHKTNMSTIVTAWLHIAHTLRLRVSAVRGAILASRREHPLIRSTLDRYARRR